MMTEPMICQMPACSLNKTMPRTNDKTAEIIFVIVTIERSASFKTFKIKNQFNAKSNPFNAKISTNSNETAILNGSHNKLSKNAIEV